MKKGFMKVCFIGGNISKAMKGEVVGGAEKQQALIIKGLKDQGLDILVLEYYLERSLNIDNVIFLPAWGKKHKTFYSKIKSLKEQIIKNDIDIIYARGTQIYIAFLYLYLKIKRLKIKRFWGIAGDHDLTSKFNYLRVEYAKGLYAKLNAGVVFNISSLLTFYSADTIICQTKEQLSRCKSISKKKSSVIISNIFLGNIVDFKESRVEADAIWIGKFSGVKGEDILLKIAKDIPDFKILCLGHVTEDFFNSEIYKEIKKQENIILLGRIDAFEVDKYISKVKFILNTSPSEGLSNVFLEGWNQKKPVISYKVNPNQYLTQWEAGYCAEGSYLNLIKKIKEIIKDDEYFKYHGENGYNILNNYHTKEIIIKKYIQLFNK